MKSIVVNRIVKALFIAVMVVFLGGSSNAQVKPVPARHIDSLMSRQAKPMLVLLSTEWCKFCYLQKSQIKKSDRLQTHSDRFYYVEFDAESNEQVRFNQQNYQYPANTTSRAIHPLAIALNGSERVSFPSVIVLDPTYRVVFRHQGILTKKQLNELAAYFLKDAF